MMKEDGCMERFERKWELWSPAIIEYALATKNKSAGLKHALRDFEGELEGTYYASPMEFKLFCRE